VEDGRRVRPARRDHQPHPDHADPVQRAPRTRRGASLGRTGWAEGAGGSESREECRGQRARWLSLRARR
jgi:hypothetical protein